MATVVLAGGLLPCGASAAVQYWDSDGNAAAGSPAKTTAGSGAWNTTAANWNLTGTASSDAVFTNGNSVVFAGTDGAANAYDISLASGLSVGAYIEFSSSGYLLDAASPTMVKVTGQASGAVIVDAGKSAATSANLTLAGSGSGRMVFAGGGTLTANGPISVTAGGGSGSLSFLNGTFNINNTLTSGTSLLIAYDDTSGTVSSDYNAVVNFNGGTYAGSSSGQLSIAAGYSAFNATGTLNVNSGNMAIGSTGATLGYWAGATDTGIITANLNVEGGTISVNGSVSLGTASSTATINATVNLDAGELDIKSVGEKGNATTSIFNFNGGLLKALQSTTAFMTLENGAGTSTGAAYVKVGGAHIDTNAFAITIGEVLQHDPTLGTTLDGGLTKSDTGTLTLSAANTYTGPTTITGGTLALSSSGSIANSSAIIVGDSLADNAAQFTLPTAGITLSNGQKLGGYGQVNGNVAIAGGVLAPGNSTGTLTVAGNVTMNASSNSTFEITGNSASLTYDQLLLTGASRTLTYGGTLTISFLTTPPSTPGTYTLFSGFSTQSGTFSNIVVPAAPSGLSWHDFNPSTPGIQYVNYATGQVQLDVGPIIVPEPASLGLLGLGALGLLRRRR